MTNNTALNFKGEIVPKDSIACYCRSRFHSGALTLEDILHKQCIQKNCEKLATQGNVQTYPNVELIAYANALAEHYKLNFRINELLKIKDQLIAKYTSNEDEKKLSALFAEICMETQCSIRFIAAQSNYVIHTDDVSLTRCTLCNKPYRLSNTYPFCWKCSVKVPERSIYLEKFPKENYGTYSAYDYVGNHLVVYCTPEGIEVKSDDKKTYKLSSHVVDIAGVYADTNEIIAYNPIVDNYIKIKLTRRTRKFGG